MIFINIRLFLRKRRDEKQKYHCIIFLSGWLTVQKMSCNKLQAMHS